MNYKFADTSFFIAFANERDENHNKAVEIATTNRGSILTTDFVILELGNYFSRVGDRESFLALLPDLQNERDLVVPGSRELMEQGIDLYGKRLDKSWSLTDCTSFLVMEEFGIVEALTTDHHFEQAGFAILLK